MSNQITFFVNDEPVALDKSEGDMPLVDYLQEILNKTGTKLCCGIGVCRACTVNTRSATTAPLEKLLACSTPVSALQGQYIYTVESLGTEEDLSPLQQAFLSNFSFQCGYCAPGFLMAAEALIERIQLTKATEDQLDGLIQTWVGENLCRCTGYVRYLEAIREVALQTIRGQQPQQSISEKEPAALYREAKA